MHLKIIYIHTKGVGWNQLHITIIYNKQNRSTQELADHFQIIIRKEKNMEIPDMPPVDLLKYVSIAYTWHFD
jgi:hypothetical protein